MEKLIKKLLLLVSFVCFSSICAQNSDDAMTVKTDFLIQAVRASDIVLVKQYLQEIDPKVLTLYRAELMQTAEKALNNRHGNYYSWAFAPLLIFEGLGGAFFLMRVLNRRLRMGAMAQKQKAIVVGAISLCALLGTYFAVKFFNNRSSSQVYQNAQDIYGLVSAID